MQVYTERGPMRVSPFLVPMMIPDTAGDDRHHPGGSRPEYGGGHSCASGTNSIGEAAEVIRRGHADAMFAGGSEASIVPSPWQD